LNRHGERLTYPDYGREEILRDFAAHRMIVEQDDGVRRHLRFRAANSSTYWFDLVTWPGVLVINGDCGTYAFARLTDMFQFFRGGNGRSEINPCYWAQKLLASDQSDGHLKYSEQLGRDAVAEEMCRLRERGAPNEVVRDLRDAAVLDEDTRSLIASVQGWSFDDWSVDDFWDHRFEDYTRRFIWNLHAIVWGIAQYDASKAPKGPACGHSACSQNFIDTGSTECVEGETDGS
jgi:hypothetical protein